MGQGEASGALGRPPGRPGGPSRPTALRWNWQHRPQPLCSRPAAPHPVGLDSAARQQPCMKDCALIDRGGVVRAGCSRMHANSVDTRRGAGATRGRGPLGAWGVGVGVAAGDAPPPTYSSSGRLQPGGVQSSLGSNHSYFHMPNHTRPQKLSVQITDKKETQTRKTGSSAPTF